MQRNLLTDSRESPEISYNNEALRKIMHAFSLVVPLGYFFIPRTICLIILLAAGITAIVLDLARMTSHPLWTGFGVKMFGCLIRPREKEGFTGASYILTTDFLVILLFSKPVAICAIAFIAIGDSAAALVGRRWGFHKYGKKSYEGSAGFLTAAMAVAFFCRYIYGDQLPLLIGISGAVLATIVEGLSVHSDDNMTVPLISGLYMQIFMAFL